MARPRLIGLVLALATVLAYLPVCRHAFLVYDDNDYVTENRVVQGGLTADGIKWAFTTWHADNWHPVTWLSHMADCQLFGLDAGAAHFINVLFHAANVILLFLLLLRLTGKVWPGAFVAALFAWHPLHVESVAWVAERKDVLSAFFGLLALIAYTRYARHKSLESVSEARSDVRDQRRKINPALRSSGFFYLSALTLFALGLMSKPMLVSLPFVILLLDYWPLGRFSSRTDSRGIGFLLWEKAPFFA